MPVLCFIFRKPVSYFFSIEKVFSQLREKTDTAFQTTVAALPHYTSSFGMIWKNILFARRQKADVYHVTGDVHYSVLGLPRKRTLLTIHDCVFMHNYKGLKRLVFKWIFLDLPVRHCPLITTISEATKKAFGKRFRAARLAAGLTQHQVAETLGVNRSYLSLVENGNENLTIETMTSLAQAVGLELHILLEQPVRSSRRKK